MRVYIAVLLSAIHGERRSRAYRKKGIQYMMEYLHVSPPIPPDSFDRKYSIWSEGSFLSAHHSCLDSALAERVGCLLLDS